MTATSTPLFDAVAVGAMDQVTRLAAQPDVNVNDTTMINKVLYTPLMLAAELGAVDVVRALLRRADVQVNRPAAATDAKKTPTPLILASTKGHVAVVQALLAHPDVDVNATMERNATAIQNAAANGFADIVDVLWSVANVLSQRRSLDAALSGQKFEVVAHMIENGVAYEPTFRGKLLLEWVAPYLTLKGLVRMLSNDLPVLVTAEPSDKIASACDDAVVVHRLVPNPYYTYSWAAFLDPSLVQVSDDIAKEAVVTAIFDSICPPTTTAQDDTSGHAISREQVVHALLSSKDQHDRPVLSVADTSLVAFLMGQLYFANRYEILDGPPVHVSATSVVVLAIDHGLTSQVFEEYASREDGLLSVDGFVACNVVLSQLAPPASLRYAPSTSRHPQTNMAEWAKEFDLWDADGIGGLTCGTFRQYCDQTYGTQLRVALKFMKHANDFAKEVACRRHLNAQFVVPLLPSAAFDNPTSASRHITINGSFQLALTEYPHVVAMPAGDRSLFDILVKERPSRNSIRAILESVAKCLAHLHESGFVHCDVKPLNVLRVRRELKLIDFDATTRTGESFAGSKFSWGTLPPEMLVKLDTGALTQQHEAYCDQASRIKDGSTHGSALAQRKLQPRGGYVVRTALAGETPGAATSSSCQVMPPYALQPVSPALDIWAFGCLMHFLITGAELLPTDIHQDIPDEFIGIAATWTDASLHAKLDATFGSRDDVAKHLISQLLRVDPAHRLSMEAALLHPYFTGQSVVQLCPSSHEAPQDAVNAALVTKDLSWPSQMLLPNACCDSMRVHSPPNESTPSPYTSVSICNESQPPIPTMISLLDDPCPSDDCRFDAFFATVGVGCTFLPSFVLLPLHQVSTPLDGPTLATLEQFVLVFQSTCHVISLALAQHQPIESHLATLADSQPLYLYLLDDVTGQVVPDHPFPTAVQGANQPNRTDGGYPLQVAPTDVTFLALSWPLVQQGLALFMKRHLSHLATPLEGVSPHQEPSLETTCTRTAAVTFGSIHRALRLNDPNVTTWHVRQAIVKFVQRWFEGRDPSLAFGGLKQTWTEDGDVLWTTAAAPTPPQTSPLQEDQVVGTGQTYQKLLQTALAPRLKGWTDEESCRTNKSTATPLAPQVSAPAGGSCGPDKCSIM